MLSDQVLEFERPVLELENQIIELKKLAKTPDVDILEEIGNLERKVAKLLEEIYTNLSHWDRVLLARHPLRPHTQDYIQHMVTDFHEIHGDRCFAEDQAIIGGFGYIGKQRVGIVGIEKGRKTNEKISRNFGMPRPEGYRKALRIMELAGQFQIPVITLVDTPGAFPGIGAEQRGQSQAIAKNLMEMFELNCPIISIVIGEGGSGGALGLAVADKVLMMEYSIYSVISPESCASILWSNPKMAETAANSLKLGPKEALEFEIIDAIIKEPPGGAHRDTYAAVSNVKKEVEKILRKFKQIDVQQLKVERFNKFRMMGNKTLTQG